MTILLIGQVPLEFGGSYTTGVGNVMVNIALDLEKKKNKIVFFATNYRGSAPSRLGDGVTIVGWRQFLGFRLVQSLVFGIFNFKALRNLRASGVPFAKSYFMSRVYQQLIEDEQPEVVSVHNVISLPSLLTLVMPVQSKVVLTLHGFFLEDKASIEDGIKRGIYFHKLYECVKEADVVTTLTQEMKRDVLRCLKLDEGKVVVIPNGTSDDFRYDQSFQSFLHEKYGLERDVLTLISVGALTKRKNHLAAIRFCQANLESFNYIIVGKPGDLAEEVERAANLDSRIILVPYVPHTELYRYYSSADFFLLPSTKEGQSLVGLEALCCGLPVLVNRDIYGSMGEVGDLGNAVVGLDMNSENVEMPLKLEVEAREALSNLARRKFQWSEVGEAYLRTFRSVG